ncbi:MAG: pilus assembly protein PilM [Candidatus Omnitrophica bacterium]|nr:pilus assembly protein PilM [Candidatus Omnitrophota bacterium]
MPASTTHYALDIGAHSLKLIRFFPGKQPQVTGTAFYRCGGSSPAKPLPQALSDFLSKEEPRRAKPIYISLSAAQTFIRYIRLPEIPESKIRRIIAFEAEQQIPFPIDEVIWDYTTLPAYYSSKERMAVLCAARKEVADTVVSQLERMRFSVRGISANAVALYHLYHQLGYDRRNVLSMDLGAQTTNVLILKGGNFWSRSLSLGGHKLREMIQEAKSISLAEAEEHVRRSAMGNASGGETKGSKEVAERFFHDLINEVSRTISFYNTQVGQIKFDQAFITGGLSLIEGLAGFVELNLGIPTRRLDWNVNPSSATDLQNGMKKELPLYAVAFGLAAGARKGMPAAIHMIPGEVRVRKEAELERRRYLGWSAALVILLSFFVGNVYLERVTKRNALEFEQARLGYYKQNADHEKELESETEKLKSKLETVRREIARKRIPTDILKELEARTPKSIWYVSLNFASKDKDVLEINGETFGSLSDINHFAEQLKQSPLFGSVEVASAGIAEGAAPFDQAPDGRSVGQHRAVGAARTFSLIIELETDHAAGA